MKFRSSKPHRLRRMLLMVGVSRLAILAWAWRNRRDLAGWARMARRVPGSLSEPSKRRALATEAKVRASITADGTARAAGLDVTMVGDQPHVMATRGSPTEQAAALEKLRRRHPYVSFTPPANSDLISSVTAPGSSALVAEPAAGY